MNYKEKPSYPLVKLDDITLQIDGKRLFEHTSWEIKSDQHWAVIGKNGSGKSTIVSALCSQGEHIPRNDRSVLVPSPHRGH